MYKIFLLDYFLYKLYIKNNFMCLMTCLHACSIRYFSLYYTFPYQIEAILHVPCNVLICLNFSLWTDNFLGGRNDCSHRNVTCSFAIFFIIFYATIRLK